MPRATIALTAVPGGATRTAAVTYTNGNHSDGMMFRNDGRTILQIVNGSGAAIYAKVTSVADPETGRTGDMGDLSTTLAIAAGATRVFNVLDPNLFNQKSGADAGFAYLDLSASTTVTVAALQFAPN